MNKSKAVFLCDGSEIYHVYNDETLAALDTLVELPRTIVTSKTLEENRALLHDAEYIFSTWGMPSLSEDQIKDYLPDLKAVFYGAGSVQGFARPFLNLGIKVFSAWGANAVPVAEYTVAEIILAGKGFYQGMRIQEAEGRWAFRRYSQTFPCNYNVKIGILGVGMIGRLVMKMLKAYHMEVLAYDPYVSDEVLAEYGAKRADLDTIFSECQTISNHIANLPATVGMLRYEHFSKMKKNATFINTGRGAQVVQPDLVRALSEEPDRTAVLDVTFPEPPAEDSPLLTMKNVILTPHIAGSMGKEVERMGEFMEAECRRLLAGEPCQYEVSLKMLETMA